MNEGAPDPGRYHLLLSSGGWPVQRGWWYVEETVRRKFTRWVGEHGTLPDARVTLTDEETGEQLAAWPDDSPGVVSGES
ncbi:hypothetical protein ACWDBD_21725 [Streptomyces sp. NPDC001118]